MAGPSSVSSVVLHDSKANDLKTFFTHGLDFQTADHDLINNYIVYRFNQYAARNLEDWSLWDSIQMDFAECEAKRFDELNNAIWRVVRDYCYIHGFWIDYNLGPDRDHTTAMLKAVQTDWNGKWTIEQIQLVERQYKTLSRITRKRKQELTGISDVDSTSSLEHPTENSLGLWAEPQIPPIPAPLTQAAPAEQVSLVQVPLAQAPPIQVPPAQGLPASAPLTPLASVESNGGQPEKYTGQDCVPMRNLLCSGQICQICQQRCGCPTTPINRTKARRHCRTTKKIYRQSCYA